MKNLNKVAANCTVVPLELLEDNKLSWKAKGLAAYICHLDNTIKNPASRSIELWKVCLDTDCMDAYKELVDAKYIEDAIGLERWGDEL